MNVEMINPFITSTVNALSTMAFIVPQRGQPAVKINEQAPNADISGVIGLSGDANGWVSIGLSRPLSLKIAENMLGEPKTYIDADVRDAVGEIVNMIAGGAKSELSQKGFSFKLAIPTVVVGDQHQIAQKKNIPYMLIPFNSAEGNFFICVCLHKD
jgi:chemotaxis protein CheX